MDKNEMIYTLLLDLKEEQTELIKETVAIKNDLKYHIYRTKLLEARTEYLVTWKQMVPIVATIGVVIGILKTLELI